MRDKGKLQDLLMGKIFTRYRKSANVPLFRELKSGRRAMGKKTKTEIYEYFSTRIKRRRKTVKKERNYRHQFFKKDRNIAISPLKSKSRYVIPPFIKRGQSVE